MPMEVEVSRESMAEEVEVRRESAGEEVEAEVEEEAPAAGRATTFAELVESCDAMGIGEEGAHQDPGGGHPPTPSKVELSAKYSLVKTLKQEIYFVPAKYEDCYLIHVLNEMPGSVIMAFVRTCESTRLLALMLRNLRFKATSNQWPNEPGLCSSCGQSYRTIRICCISASLVNQFEGEFFKLTEHLLEGKQIPDRKADADEIMILHDSISDAKRIALKTMNESVYHKRMRAWRWMEDGPSIDHEDEPVHVAG
uniref:Uncharacterized protein n=1 Tax=Oryza brachyantha TaxID=4533 RepID=J3MNR5_ORYBR